MSKDARHDLLEKVKGPVDFSTDPDNKSPRLVSIAAAAKKGESSLDK